MTVLLHTTTYNAHAHMCATCATCAKTLRCASAAQVRCRLWPGCAARLRGLASARGGCGRAARLGSWPTLRRLVPLSARWRRRRCSSRAARAPKLRVARTTASDRRLSRRAPRATCLRRDSERKVESMWRASREEAAARRSSCLGSERCSSKQDMDCAAAAARSRTPAASVW